MKRRSLVLVGAAALATIACTPKPADTPNPVERGKYLATVGGCHDCHTPKLFKGPEPELDTSRLLSGHPADAALPEVPAGVIDPRGWTALTNGHLSAWAGPWGTSFAANLTPHATGLAAWDEATFIKALRSGKHAGVGRPILPPMPWFNYAQMTDDDLKALFAFLKSLPPVDNKVPEPKPPVAPAGASAPAARSPTGGPDAKPEQEPSG